MATVNVRELARNTSKVIDDVSKKHRPTLITRAGRPVAAVVPIDAEALENIAHDLARRTDRRDEIGIDAVEIGHAVRVAANPDRRQAASK